MRTNQCKRAMAMAAAAAFFFSNSGFALAKEEKKPLPSDAMEAAQRRGLTPDDITAAVSTYMPSGRYDDYYMFASGGQSGQVFVIGLPSMRLLRSIAVFTPEP